LLIPELDLSVSENQDPALNVLVPSFSRFRRTGGPNTIFGLTYRLAARGMRVRYIGIDGGTPKDDGSFWEHLWALTGVDNANGGAELSDGVIGARDAFMATWWPTAYVARRWSKKRPFIYFIQDYEPLFCKGEDVGMAKDTLDMDFRGIVNERTVAESLPDGCTERCAIFEPAVDRRIFKPNGHTSKCLVFYARPNRKRNCYSAALAALQAVAKTGLLDGWTVYSVGYPLRPISLSPGLTMRNRAWQTYYEYSAMMRGSDVVLAPQLSPHTGYASLEAVACGGVAVTTPFGAKTEDRLKEYSSRIIATKPGIDDMANAIEKAVRMDRRVGDDCNVAKSWDAAFAPVLPKVERMVEECMS